jgi:hypothetical protein
MVDPTAPIKAPALIARFILARLLAVQPVAVSATENFSGKLNQSVGSPHHFLHLGNAHLQKAVLRFVLQVQKLAKISGGFSPAGSYPSEVLRVAMVLGSGPLLQGLAAGSVRSGDASEYGKGSRRARVYGGSILILLVYD